MQGLQCQAEQYQEPNWNDSDPDDRDEAGVQDRLLDWLGMVNGWSWLLCHETQGSGGGLDGATRFSVREEFGARVSCSKC